MSTLNKNSVGFLISKKENERRRAILPEDILKVKNKTMLCFEKGYGELLGIKDSAYSSLGCRIVSREEALTKDIICDPKVGDAEYLASLQEGQVLFGWIHAVQNKEITDLIIKNKLSAYAWEDMFNKGRHIFWRNNVIAGEAAIMHAFQCYGDSPFGKKVAVLGKGNTAIGALKILNQLGSEVTIYDRKTENLFREELSRFDVVVNAILWDTSRDDHILYKEDLHRMKKNSMIIDVSCDRNGGIETCIPTTIEDPTYMLDSVLHYAVDHTPSIWFSLATKSLSVEVCQYIDQLIEGNAEEVLRRSLIIDKGVILDERINYYQGRKILEKQN